MQAIKEYDGANAAGMKITLPSPWGINGLTIIPGQPIRLTLLPGRESRRNPFDTAVMPGRPLAERVTAPADRARSLSPGRNHDDGGNRKRIDRYVPGMENRSRSPRPPRRQGRRPGNRRDGGSGRDQDEERNGQRRGREGRLKKTQEELDAEMEDYFGSGSNGASARPANGGSNAAVANDDDMIE
jgi:THO complex subunit 4